MYPNEMTSPADLRVAALQNSPAFLALYSHAPESIIFKGKVYNRDSALTVEERLWYLSALALVNPALVAQLAQTPIGPYSLDADDSEVVAAQKAVRDCEAKVSALTQKRKSQLALVKQAQDAIENMKSGENIALGFLTAGIATAAQLAEHQIALNQRKGILVQIENELEEAKTACQSARVELSSAQSRLNEANRKIRETEEKERIAALQEQAARATAEAERKEAERAAKAAADAAAKRAKQAEQEASAPPPSYGEPDPSNWNPGDYPAFGEEEPWPANCEYYGDCNGNPDDSYWADAMEAQVFGDEQATADQLAAMGEVPPRFSDSPYYYDRYYACDACPQGYDASDFGGLGCDDESCEACAQLDGYGAEGDGVLAIFAGLLAIAPSVINAFNAPAGGAGGNVTKETTDKILKETGVQDKIDAAAAREGEKVKTTVIVIGVGLGILILKALA